VTPAYAGGQVIGNYFDVAAPNSSVRPLRIRDRAEHDLTVRGIDNHALVFKPRPGAVVTEDDQVARDIIYGAALR
jgi:hypothetical protein